ncbi:MAG: ACP S-malonyltransferase [Candidatus Omnitrophota bacterium]
MVAYLFAGQGSQYVGMGKDLYDTFPESRNIFEKADKALKFPLTKLIFEGPQDELTKTQNSQPAILTVTIAALEAFKSKFRTQNSEVKYSAGLSLGEYSALVASGALSFEDAVSLVRRRGELMEEEALKKPGKMLSVIGLELNAVKEICDKAATEIANINCPGQVVISGGAREIEKAKELAKGMNAKMALELQVSGAFHSSYMKEASVEFAATLNKVKMDSPAIPVVSNVTARVANSGAEIKENLIKQVYSSVLWEDSMRYIISKGVQKCFEFGPGKVLKGLMRRIDASITVVTIEKKQDILSLIQEA